MPHSDLLLRPFPKQRAKLGRPLDICDRPIRALRGLPQLRPVLPPPIYKRVVSIAAKVDSDVDGLSFDQTDDAVLMVAGADVGEEVVVVVVDFATALRIVSMSVCGLWMVDRGIWGLALKSTLCTHWHME